LNQHIAKTAPQKKLSYANRPAKTPGDHYLLFLHCLAAQWHGLSLLEDQQGQNDWYANKRLTLKRNT
jgi:hypothetical protein